MADNGEEVQEKCKEPCGPWLVVSYGKNERGSVLGTRARTIWEEWLEMGGTSTVTKGSTVECDPSQKKSSDLINVNTKKMQEKIGLKIGKSKVISTSNKVNVDTVDTTSSKGSRFKTLEEDVIVLENRIRGRRLLEPSWTSLIGRRKPLKNPPAQSAEVEEILEDLGVLKELHR
ncbi:hypothetical protein ACOSQ3_018501 [Xanthoceras sorbifolium]